MTVWDNCHLYVLIVLWTSIYDALLSQMSNVSVCLCVMKKADTKRAHCFMYWIYCICMTLSFCLSAWFWIWNVRNDWTLEYAVWFASVWPLISQQEKKHWYVNELYCNRPGIYVIVAWLAKHFLLWLDVISVMHAFILQHQFWAHFIESWLYLFGLNSLCETQS